MEAEVQVELRSLEPFRHLFPKAELSTTRLKRNATVFDTVNTVREEVAKYAWQVKDFVKQELGGLSTNKAFEKLWYFLKYHIRYERDEPGYEQVKTPRRLISDGYGDCDDYTFFINCCAAVLNTPGLINRITKYSKQTYQHIYPVVLLASGKYIVVDCVVHAFNYEEPYNVKKDYKMELQILDGIDDQKMKCSGVDMEDLFDEYEDDFGAISLKNVGQKLQSAAQNVAQTIASGAQNVAQTVQTATQNVAQTVQTAVQNPASIIHTVNQVNPAVTLLRVGFLASMKLNVMNVAGNLRWAYLSRENAESRGLDPSKHDQLVRILTKAEQVFYGAGGSKENLREAILTGNGNPNSEVTGLYGGGQYNKNQKLSYILGPLYTETPMSGLNGNGLGEPVTAASIAAASSAVGALAALIAQLGDLFKKKQDAPPPPAPTPAPDGTPTPPPDYTMDFSDFSVPGSANTPATNPPGGAKPPAQSGGSSSGGSNQGSNPGVAPDADKPGGLSAFWEKNKVVVLSVGGVVVVTGLGLLTYKLVKSKNKKPAPNGLAGIRRTANTRKGKRKYPKTARAINLM